MNWFWILIIIPVIVAGVALAYFVFPKTPDYVPPTKTTTTTTRTTISRTTTSTVAVQTTTATSFSPCVYYNGECKTQCSQAENSLPASCEVQGLVCCQSTATTTTTSQPPLGRVQN